MSLAVGVGGGRDELSCKGKEVRGMSGRGWNRGERRGKRIEKEKREGKGDEEREGGRERGRRGNEVKNGR